MSKLIEKAGRRVKSMIRAVFANGPALAALLLLQAWPAAAPAAAGSEGSPGEDEIVIHVRKTSRVAAADIRLGDIAEIRAAGFLKPEIEHIRIGASPRPGEIKVVERRKLNAVIDAQPFIGDGVMMTCPEQIYIKRKSMSLDNGRVTDALDEFLDETFSGGDYRLYAVETGKTPPYPLGKLSLAVDPDCRIDPKGRIMAYVDVIIDGTVRDRIAVKARVDLFEPVALAARELKRGKNLTPADVYFEKRNVFALGPGAARTWEDLDGRAPRYNIRQGRVIMSGRLKQTPLVKRGQTVRLFIRKGGLLIMASGISREDGYMDSRIKVENARSGRMVNGIVRDGAKVEVIH